MGEGTGEDHDRHIEDQIRQLLEQHGPSVYRVARSIVRDQALAEDVVQETFIRAWQHADSYSGDVPIRNWLLRIAHNVGVSTLRTVRDEATDPATLPHHPAGTAGPATVVVDRMTIIDALDSLDVTARTLVVLREVEGLSYHEISQVLDLSLPTVKTRLFRARAQLRDLAKEGL